MILLDKALLCLQNKTPFVVYAKPEENILNGVFQKDTVLNVFEKQRGFVFAGFYKETDVVFPLSDSEFFQEEISIKVLEGFTQVDYMSTENTQVTFENLVLNAISEIEKGTFEKVVLSRKIEISQAIDLITSFKLLLQKYTTAFRYLWYHPKVGFWMGASPEQLVKIKNNTFETVALAGTKVFSENVLWQEKEINEQQLVIDYIKRRTETLVEKFLISDTFTQKAGDLAHIKCVISGVLKQNVSEIDVIYALHPTSAVCGMSLENSRNFILENEKYDRKYYAGFLGEFQMHDQTNLFVNLRCCEIIPNVTLSEVEVFAEKIFVYVGCGITKDSQADKEFIETENKAKTILSILSFS